MTEDIEKMKKQIIKLNFLLQLYPDNRTEDENVQKIREELYQLSYLYYKAVTYKMRNMEGYGDGI